MPVVKKPRYLSRGVVRAQLREAIAVGERLLTAGAKNTSLQIFVGPTGPGSASWFEETIAQWKFALALKG